MNNPKQAEPVEMSPELFKELAEGLKAIFDRNLSRDPRNINTQQQYGRTAVEAAAELRKLYRDCKPGR